MNEQLKVIISAEIDKLKQSVATAKKTIADFTKDSEKGASQMDEAFQKAGEGIKTALKGAAVAITGAVAALVGMNAATAEYRNNQAKLQTAFEAAGGGAREAAQTYNDLYRVLGDDAEATEAAQNLARLTTNEKELSQWTNIAKGIYATFGDSIPLTTISESAAETAACGQITGDLSRALVEAGVSEEEFQESLDACADAQEREALIRDTLNGLYSDAADKYEENNAAILEQNDANRRFTDTMATLGEKMAPVVTTFTNFANQALSAITPYISDLTANLLPVLQTLLDGIVYALESALGWISQHTTAIQIIAAVIGTIVTAIGLYNTVAAVKAAMDAAQVTTLWGLVSAYAAQAAAMIVAIAPYALIAAAIAGVIALILNWEEVLQWIKDTWANVSEWVGNKVKSMAESVGKWFGNMRERIGSTKLGEFVLKIFDGIANSIKQKIELAKTIIQNVIGLIKGIFTGDLGAVKTSVQNIFGAIGDNIRNKLETAKNIVSNAINAIKGFFNFSWSLPKLKMPHLTVTGKLDLFKIPPSIPRVSVEWYAKGGVFDKPTLFNYGDGSIGGLGEAGAEAVVPLEKNTKWLDIIADKLAARQGSTPVVLNVDGKVFAQTSIDAINNHTRQRGSLALNLV